MAPNGLIYMLPHTADNLLEIDPSGAQCQDDASWVDNDGNSCSEYLSNSYCLDGGYGPGWNMASGTFADFAVGGVDAHQACCECGWSGTMTVSAISISSSLHTRNVQATHKFSGGVLAPNGKIYLVIHHVFESVRLHVCAREMLKRYCKDTRPS